MSWTREVKFSVKEEFLIQLEINKLLKKGAIVECEPVKDQFLSPFFLVPKPNGTKRFILNLKNLNKYIHTSHFKLEDLRSMLRLISKDSYMCNLDLKDAYFLVPVKRSSRKFLRFRFRGIILNLRAYTIWTMHESTRFYEIIETNIALFKKIWPSVNSLPGRFFVHRVFFS